MLSIQSTASPASSEKCTPNILPCRIARTGPVNASERYWTPETTQGQTCLLETSAHSSKFAEIFLDGKKIAYFRGRKLVGKQVALPEGYRGAVVRKSDRTIQPPVHETASIPITHADVDKLDGEDEQREEPIRILEEEASFEEVIIWGHESLPAADDVHVRGMDEWVSWAEAMHSFGDEKQKS
ncbi:3'-5' exonuclease [Varicellaria rhodocarpa]|nr:3'-5' exonuclease [Varicellaria rhodocarpa]